MRFFYCIMERYVKLYESIIDWQHFKQPGYLQVWISILMRANYKDGYDRQGRKVKKGQVILSQREFCEDCGMSRNTFIRVLYGLKKSGEIKIETDRNYTLVTIVNWSKYQNDGVIGGICSGSNFEPRVEPRVEPKVEPIQEIIEIKKERKNIYIYKPTEFKKFFDSLNNLWRESAMMAIKVTSHTEFDNWIEDFINYAIATSDETKSENQIKGHFINWVKQEKKNRERQQQKTQYTPQKNVAPCNTPEKYAMDISSRDFSQGFVKIQHNNNTNN